MRVGMREPSKGGLSFFFVQFGSVRAWTTVILGRVTQPREVKWEMSA